MAFPLEGLRVLDGTWNLASAGGTRYLAALGAEVIRFEWKAAPDTLRYLNPLAPDGGRAERDQAVEAIVPARPSSLNRGGYFNDINSGRRGISLNMHHPKAKEIFRQLIAVSDVYAEGYTATTMERWGLPFSELVAINPKLVYCQQPGFGYHGKYRDYRTVGPIANALSGLTEMVGLPEPYPPAGWGYSYSDWTGAYNLALAILAGVSRQRRTGEAVWIDASQLESAIAYTGTAMLDKQANGRSYQRSGNQSPAKSAAPHGAYRCQGQDRWLAIAVFCDAEWQSLCAVIGHPVWTGDPHFATMESRIEHHEELDGHVETWTSQQDAYEAMDLLQRAGVRAGVCQNAQDRIERDPQLRHLDWLVELPQSEIGTWPVKNVPFSMSATAVHQGGTLQRGAPSYGEDNSYVLKEILGMSADDIQELTDEGAI
jgi:crotonobetainyl-CoA:carnitine CoA-transferase CaiB-like acyl-CoA transferase